MPSPALAPGARVVVRDEEWLVRRTHKANPGGSAVHVTGLSELVRGKDAIFLSDLDDIEELAPEKTALVTDDSPRYRKTRLYLEALLRRTPPPAGDDRIYLGHRGAIRSAPYQLHPAAKALRQPRPRLLIADGVGLGKTIETGILLTELIERHRAERILVVALKSILAQFQQELWARFTIPLVRLDSVGIQRVQSRIPSSMNPFHYFDRVIISIDTLKKDAKYRRYLEQCRWDVIVIDECQNVAGDSQRAQLARLLARTTDALILTSATPHNGKAESFASIIKLLEQTSIADPSSFTREEVEDYFVRRFKKDIAHEAGGAFQERISDPRHIPASPAEDRVFATLKHLAFRTVTNQRNSRGILFRTLLLKAFLSSPSACIATIDERLRTLERLEEQGKREAEDVAHDRSLLTDLRAQAAEVTPDVFGKYRALLDMLRELGFGKRGSEERIVIFSERIDTLRFLQERLTADLGLGEERTALFYGALDDQRQRQIVDRFSTADTPLRILLASDAASEGLNLHHHCHRLVHFDLPWSLITLEQRNGRIDRYGQRAQPVLTCLLTRPGNPELQGDLRILDLLVEKESAAHRNLGDVARLLDLYDVEAEEDRIARGIEDGEDPDAVLPDSDEPGDSLDWLFGAEDDGASTVRETAEVTEDPTLYADDLAYSRDALTALQETRDDLHVTFHDHLDGLTLAPPADLQHRLGYLPPELLEQRDGSRPVLKLTADRQRVMDALDEARKSEGRWPEWQLLWEQHPVCEWLDGAVLAAFDRHEAPLLRVQHGLAPGETVFVVQGQLTNERGQPIVVEWFGVSCDEGRPPQIRPFRSLVEQTGLDRPLSNPGLEIPEAARRTLEALLPAVVATARDHMGQRRIERMASLAEPIRTQLQDVELWRQRQRQILDNERARYASAGRKLPGLTQKRLEREAHEADRVFEERQTWLQQGIKTHKSPYLRILAALAKA